MVMISLLNVGSLVFGAIAWVLPVCNLIKNKRYNRNWMNLSIISMGACASSLCLQMVYNNYLVNSRDWTALMDTSGFLVIISSFMLIVTIILNVITLFAYGHRREQ